MICPFYTFLQSLFSAQRRSPKTTSVDAILHNGIYYSRIGEHCCKGSTVVLLKWHKFILVDMPNMALKSPILSPSAKILNILFCSILDLFRALATSIFHFNTEILQKTIKYHVVFVGSSSGLLIASQLISLFSYKFVNLITAILIFVICDHPALYLCSRFNS